MPSGGGTRDTAAHHDGVLRSSLPGPCHQTALQYYPRTGPMCLWTGIAGVKSQRSGTAARARGAGRPHRCSPCWLRRSRPCRRPPARRSSKRTAPLHRAGSVATSTVAKVSAFQGDPTDTVQQREQRLSKKQRGTRRVWKHAPGAAGVEVAHRGRNVGAVALGFVALRPCQGKQSGQHHAAHAWQTCTRRRVRAQPRQRCDLNAGCLTLEKGALFRAGE